MQHTVDGHFEIVIEHEPYGRINPDVDRILPAYWFHKQAIARNQRACDASAKRGDKQFKRRERPLPEMPFPSARNVDRGMPSNVQLEKHNRLNKDAGEIKFFKDEKQQK